MPHRGLLGRENGLPQGMKGHLGGMKGHSLWRGSPRSKRWKELPNGENGRAPRRVVPQERKELPNKEAGFSRGDAATGDALHSP